MTPEQEFILKDFYIVYLPDKSQEAFSRVLEDNKRLNEEKEKFIKLGYEMFGALAFDVKGHVNIIKSINLLEKKPISIYQSDVLEQYGSIVVFGKALQSIDVCIGNKSTRHNPRATILKVGNAKGIVVDFDVNYPITNIVVSFEKKIIDDLQLNFQYVKNPKGIVDPKVALHKQMSVRHAIGEGLLNIFFQPASEEVSKTIIELYVGDGRFDRGQLKNVSNRQLISKKTYDKDTLMATFKELAPSVYSYRVIQLNADDIEVFSSNIIDVHLQKPNYSGKPTIYN